MESTFNRVSLADVVRGYLRTLPDSLQIIKGMLYMLRIGPNRNWSLGRLLETQARRFPDRPALRFGEREWSYSEFNARVNQVAALLVRQGIRSGDVVGVLMETRPELLVCVAAVVKLGAVAGMLNYNQRDAVLMHSINLIKPKLMITSAECVAALETTSFMPQQNAAIKHFWLACDEAPCPAGFTDLEAASRSLPTDNPAATATVKMNQPCFYIFTSGTTGLPKASVMTHYRWLAGMVGVGMYSMRLRPDDVLYVVLPFYHNNALTVSWGAALGAGACMALTRKFSASRFWDEVRHYRATTFCYIGELCRYLLNQPPREADRQHAIRVIAGNGLRPEIWDEFKQRFGIPRIAEFYGASECNLAFVNYFNIDGSAGMCPLPFAVVAYDPDTEQPLRNSAGRLQRVKNGDTGLLITRISKLAPFDGYTDSKASEKKLLHNVFKKGDSWFNTGDLVRKQGFFHIQFVDRLGDTFRWKGENVATTEVEAVVNSDQQVEQAVVYGVQVPNADGRAGMAAVTLRVPLEKFNGKALASTLEQQLPGYAVPIFLRVRHEHEITGTFKNRKVELKNEGFDPEQVKDPLFYYAGREQGYRQLDDSVMAQIRSGSFRL
ncbi:MAG TPA: long-chain-acyl-CoA synthetase [Pseudomonadales bacterium]|nr:long-chain-acyl-CoA synthetase [Pseudomonadales bacterium]